MGPAGEAAQAGSGRVQPWGPQWLRGRAVARSVSRRVSGQAGTPQAPGAEPHGVTASAGSSASRRVSGASPVKR